MARVSVLLHGFLRTGASMRLVGRRLREHGYDAKLAPTFGYHLAPLDRYAERAAELSRTFAGQHPGAEIDLVTHSYGGVLARAALATGRMPTVRRIVMISPPNQWARVAERVVRQPMEYR